MLRKVQAVACAALVGYALTLGCSEEKLGAAGESCERSADCQEGLSCSDQICTKGGGGPAPGSGGQGSTGQRGAEGESCQTRRDCVEGLLCIRNTCSTGSDAGTIARAGGTLGESCQTSSDCAEAYICVQSTCVLGDHSVEPTGNECVLVQCEKPADCCPQPSSVCASWKQQCELAGGFAGAAGSTSKPFACQQYENPLNGCVCDASKYKCEAHTCRDVSEGCTIDQDCFGAGKCHDGACVECIQNSDCSQVLSDSLACSNNRCVPACKNDSSCPALHSCQNGACVEVGCKEDRECIALKKDVRSRCQAGKCAAPCDKDAECNVAGFSFQGCVDGYCQDLGCKTHEECKIRLNRVSSVSTQQALCLPKAP